MKLKDQVAIVTGGGRNIGEEVSRLLAQHGAKVLVVDLDPGRGESVAKSIRDAGGEALAHVADVSKEADAQSIATAAMEKWGRVDVLVNNAAISDNKHLFDISLDEWNRVLAVTLTAPFLVSKYVAKAMVEGGRAGAIVNVGSTSGFFGRKRAIAYTAAKGGVANLTRSLAVQLSGHGIRVNGVVPNKIGSPVGKDEFDPTRPVVNLRGRPGVPADLANAILFLASSDADFITGQMLFVDGGVSAELPSG